MQEHDTSEFIAILRHKSKLKSYLAQLNSTELRSILPKFTTLVEEILSEKEEEEKAKKEAIRQARSLLLTGVLSKTELEALFTELVGKKPQSLSRTDNTARRRKSALPIKYRADIEVETGKIVSHTWTGLGRRPAFFNGLTEYELAQYQVVDDD